MRSEKSARRERCFKSSHGNVHGPVAAACRAEKRRSVSSPLFHIPLPKPKW